MTARNHLRIMRHEYGSQALKPRYVYRFLFQGCRICASSVKIIAATIHYQKWMMNYHQIPDAARGFYPGGPAEGEAPGRMLKGARFPF
jgi:hypothetical protein